MTKITDPRTLAVNVLTRVRKQKSYANLALDAELNASGLSARDSALATQIVYGVIQNQLRIAYELAPFIGKKKVDPWVRVLLETAVYQYAYLDKIPTRAIFYESTRIAKQMGHAGTGKFVTGVLRALEREGLPSVDSIEEPIERLSVTYSMPRWLVSRMISEVGEEKAVAIFASLNQPARASIRVNTTRTTRTDLLAALDPEFPQVEPSAISPDGITTAGGHLAGTSQFAAGDYTMQDESSMLVAPSLAVEPGNRVLDACAAPGGKTTHIAQFLDSAQGGSVLAVDLHPHKVKLIADNARRLGLSDRIQTQAADARDLGQLLEHDSFDRVLVDAPCSGLGLMRRKPEIRYEKTAADIENLQKIQIAILNSVAPLVKLGGRLTYSTCTMVKAENQEVVEQFLATHPDFVLEPVPVASPLAHAHHAPYLQLYPDDYNTDGFFIAALVRKA